MNSLLAVIPIDQPSFGLITYNNFTNTQNIINNNTLDSLDIQIKGEDQNFINFNNTNWTMTLKLCITRTVKKPLEIINNNIKPIEIKKKKIKI